MKIKKEFKVNIDTEELRNKRAEKKAEKAKARLIKAAAKAKKAEEDSYINFCEKQMQNSIKAGNDRMEARRICNAAVTKYINTGMKNYDIF